MNEWIDFYFRGYVAVCNRSQKDINENMTIKEGISKETVSIFMIYY